MTIRVQTEDFDAGAELAAMRVASASVGAVVNFIGQVRDINDGDTVSTLTLEHYPGMTERSLEAIEAEAKARWDIVSSLIIHRVGTLQPLDQIVLVAVASAHRGEAFEACEFIMDYLKVQAPFWKKESTLVGERWVEAKTRDNDAQVRWKSKNN
ncbi:MAG: molybdopterin synthase catalytic subunit MoaE [Methylophilaceae bacterium]|jgi:molybdopterin synthase catalytic subunit